jgi:hypothetical protein
MPPYLAGREKQQAEFKKLLQQQVILENIIVTGLRGVGKTVLLTKLRDIAINVGWQWIGTDLSESESVSEEKLAIRILADLSVVTSGIRLEQSDQEGIGFLREPKISSLNHEALHSLYAGTPGLVSDKLKRILEITWYYLSQMKSRGLIFAYDEAQNLADHAKRSEFPLSLLLDVFQSIQRKNIPFMLVLTGLPTLFPRLVESRTYSERMFHIMFLKQLTPSDSRDAILMPITREGCPYRFTDQSVDTIIQVSGGYPYFIQFICREVYDLWRQALDSGELPPEVPVEEILSKLDIDFFAGRWARATDRQRELLELAAVHLVAQNREFTIQELVSLSRTFLERPFGSSQVNQMLSALCDKGLVYRDRHGKYLFAVPLLDNFIRRQAERTGDGV